MKGPELVWSNSKGIMHQYLVKKIKKTSKCA